MKIYSKVRRQRIEIIDIQFEYKSFGSHIFTLVGLPILVFLLRRHSRIVITVHGVLTYESLLGRKARLLTLSAYILSVRMAALASRELIVHTEEMKEKLRRYGVTNTTVIPHGCTTLGKVLARSGNSNILFFGFLRPSKGIDKLITAFKQVTNSEHGARLLVAGSISDASDRAYLENLRKLVCQLELGGRVEFRVGFVSELEKESLAAEATILVLPYEDTFLEASGVAHDFAGLGLAMICSRTPRFEEFKDEINCLKTPTAPSEIAQRILRLLALEDERRMLSDNLGRLAISESWSNVAKTRLELYEMIAKPIKA
jgi:glycosyltransferase involved in cell wall biosynthesis